jgi:transposase
MTKKSRRYTAEFKQEAIKLALKSPNVEQTARGLGIPSATLHTWLHNLKAKGTVSAAKPADEKNIAALLEENRRLHKELAIAKEEKEILKKAAAYFAQHQK